MTDDAEAKKKRAERLREKIGKLDVQKGPSAQRPGESDAEYVHRRMREIDRKPKGR